MVDGARTRQTSISIFMITDGTIGAGVASVTAGAMLIGVGTIGAGEATVGAGTVGIDGTIGVGEATMAAGTIGAGEVMVTDMPGVLRMVITPITETEIMPTIPEGEVITIIIP